MRITVTITRAQYRRNPTTIEWRWFVYRHVPHYGTYDTALVSPGEHEDMGESFRTKAEALAHAAQLREQYRPFKRITREQYAAQWAENLAWNEAHA